MTRFYRFQYGSYTLTEMQEYVSVDGGEGYEELGIEPEGICACECASDLRRNTVYDARDTVAVIVEFEGQKVMDIYDGVRAYPIEIVRYWTPAEFEAAYEAGDIE